MKKFLALLCTMAMVLSMFSGIALAAPGDGNENAALGKISYYDTSEAGYSTGLNVPVSDPQGLKKVTVDFSGTEWAVKDAGRMPAQGWTATISGDKVIYTFDTTHFSGSVATEAVFIPTVINPSSVQEMAFPKVYVTDNANPAHTNTESLVPQVADANDVDEDGNTAELINQDPLFAEYTITTNNTWLASNGDAAVTGTVKVNGALTKDLVRVVILKGEEEVISAYTEDGNFDLTFTPDAATGDDRYVAYTLKAYKVEDNDDNAVEIAGGSVSLKGWYSFTLNNDMGKTYAKNALVPVSGTLKAYDTNGDAVTGYSNVRVAITKRGLTSSERIVVDTIPVASKGTFSKSIRLQDADRYHIGIIQYEGADVDWDSVKGQLTTAIDDNDYIYTEYGTSATSTFANVSAETLGLTVDGTVTEGMQSKLTVTVKDADGEKLSHAKVVAVQNGAQIATGETSAADATLGEATLTFTTYDDAAVTIKAYYEYSNDADLWSDSDNTAADNTWYDNHATKSGTTWASFAWTSISFADASGSTTVNTSEQEKLNLTLSDEKITAGQETPVDLTIAGNDDYDVASYTVAISGLNQDIDDVAADGAVVKNDKIRVDEVTADPTDLVQTLTFKPEVAGTITITVTADLKDKDGDPAGSITKTATVEVEGYVMTVTGLDNAAAGSTTDVTVTLTEADGTPINNAVVVMIADELYGSNENEMMTWKNANDVTQKSEMVVFDGKVNNGIYTKKVTFNRAADVKVVAYDYDADVDLTDLDASAADIFAQKDFKVYGTPTYTVTPSNTNLVAGLKEGLTFTVTDANGNNVSNTAISVEGLDPMEDTDVTYTYGGTSTADGKTTYTLSNIIADKAGEFKVVASEPTTGAQQGSFVVKVVAPKLASDLKVTDGFKDVLDVKVVDPRNGNPIKGKLTIDFEGANVKNIWDAQDNKIQSPEGDAEWIAEGTYEQPSNLVDSEFKFAVLATDKEEVGEAVAPKMILTFKIDGDNAVDLAEVPFAAPTLTANPGTVVANSVTPVTITLASANGVGIADVDVNVMGQDIGATDENGQIAYSVNPQTYGNYNMTVTNDLDKKVTGKLVVAADATAPELTVTAPATVKTNTAVVTGTAKDNVKVQSVYVNNQQVMVIPGAEATFDYEVALKPGVNNIKVVAFDAAGNATQATATVNYVLPTVVKLAIGSADATINGQAATGVAPYLKGNSTMVPFRFIAEALGATVDYNNGVVTMTLEGKTVVLTIGSAVAMVDGTAVNMPVAAEIVNDRTMIPLRFVSENLGATVDWNAATSGITITR